MLKRLIVNADDFGLTPGVNQGIIEACKAGIVTTTSDMIKIPYAEEGIMVAQKETPSLCGQACTAVSGNSGPC